MASGPGSRLLTLLQAAAQGREDVPLATFGAADVRWALETGLGPLLCRATRGDPAAAAAPLWPLVQGADLTARLLTAEALNAVDELLDACAGQVPPLTLLKGISIGTQYYPAPHLRPMRDIDVLVGREAVPAVESRLTALGYRRPPAPPGRTYAAHHHGPPLWHPTRGLWVEVHWGLFRPGLAVAADRVFSAEHVRGQLQASTFRGRSVLRLSPELQIVYTAAHWALGLRRVGGLVAPLDLLYLLRQAGAAVRWDRLLAWVDGAAAAPALTLLLTYLTRAGVLELPPARLRELRRTQRALTRTNLRLWHRFLDRHLVRGGRGLANYPVPFSGWPARHSWRAAWGLASAWRARHGLLISDLLPHVKR